MTNISGEFKDNFNSGECNKDLDIQDVLGKHFSHPKEECIEGEQVITGAMYNVRRKLARFLLWSLKHDIPVKEKDIKSFNLISSKLSEGNKALLNPHPIIINTSTNTIVDGSKRLLALALGTQVGVYFEIKFTH
jgi:hypothetical protein